MRNPIHNRDDLLDLFAAFAPTDAVLRAIRAGSVEVFGAFARIPPDQRPGYVAIATTASGRRWTLAVVEAPHSRRGAIGRVLDRIPWEHHEPERGVVPADDPETALSCRNQALFLLGAVNRAVSDTPSQATQESAQ